MSADHPTTKRRAAKFGARAATTSVGCMLGFGRQSQANLLGLLQDAQESRGHLSVADVEEAACRASVSPAVAQGVASFYSLLEVGSGPGQQRPSGQHTIRVCDGPSCCLRGGEQLASRLRQLSSTDNDVRVLRTSCLGQCERAPAILVDGHPLAPVSHDTLNNLSSLLTQQEESVSWSAIQVTPGACGPDQRPLTEHFGVIDPWSLATALDAGAYEALRKACEVPPAKLVDEVEAADLRGRGGAGFRTGWKWRMAADMDAPERFVICNADESEPGTFKDRALIEKDPHLLLEGMAICARAIGADEGIIYIRGEYEAAARLLEHAISEARVAGFLGEGICGTNARFDVHVHRGAGAYICGEETALLESLDGKRGEPRARPPFPTTFGHRGMPTVVNNVETLCAVPFIVGAGAEAYRQLGRGESAGTKLLCLSGHVVRPGVYEAPAGLSTREAIDELGGGVTAGQRFKLALAGGAAGTFVPPSLLEVPLSDEPSTDGVAVGSGAIMVADQTVSAATMLLWILHFFEHESCGKCTPCRIGTRQARQITARFAQGAGRPGDRAALLRLAKTLDRSSFCGLGHSVAWPIESAIRYFPEDFVETSVSSTASSGGVRCHD